MDLYLEGSILACEILSVILGGECNVNVKFLVDALANDLLLKSGNEGAGAELKSVISALAALKCNAVAEAFKIDNGGIAKLCSSVGNVDLTRVSLTDSLDLTVNILVAYGSNFLFYLNTEIVLDLNLRLYVNLCGENETVLVDRNYVKLGLTNSVDSSFLKSLGVSVGNKVVDSVLIENAGAIHLLDDRAGSLTLSEAGNGDVLDLLAINVVYCSVKCCFVNRKL